MTFPRTIHNIIEIIKQALPVPYPHGKPQETAEPHHHCPDQSYAENHRV